jgi:nucleoside-diphosphate-sugar epimerase
MARKRMLAQVGPGSNYFSSICISDAGSAVAAALAAPAGVYNVCDDDPISFADYVRTAADSAGAPKPLHVPGFLGRLLFGTVWKYLSPSLRVSNAKLKTASTWTPQVKSVRAIWKPAQGYD